MAGDDDRDQQERADDRARSDSFQRSQQHVRPHGQERQVEAIVDRNDEEPGIADADQHPEGSCSTTPCPLAYEQAEAADHDGQRYDPRPLKKIDEVEPRELRHASEPDEARRIEHQPGIGCAEWLARGRVLRCPEELDVGRRESSQARVRQGRRCSEGEGERQRSERQCGHCRSIPSGDLGTSPRDRHDQDAQADDDAKVTRRSRDRPQQANQKSARDDDDPSDRLRPCLDLNSRLAPPLRPQGSDLNLRGTRGSDHSSTLTDVA